eukprot:2187360-Ditylum_brightwellii.AAC.1
MVVCFKSALLRGIYQDDGLVVFEGRQTRREITLWLKGFQAKVNKLAGGDYLQFTTKLWRPVTEGKQAMTHMDDEDGWEDDGEISKALWKKVAVRDEEWFPFWGMRMRRRRNKLEFQVYQKENQLLKYIDIQSTHHPSTFPLIATRIITRLCWLMSWGASLRETQVDEIYPEHAEALRKAGLAPGIFLTFGEIWEKDDGRLMRKKKK